MNRNKKIDIWKGIAIILVITTHWTWKQTERDALFFPLWIDAAVPIFMILSGYTLAKSIENKNIQSIEQAYDKKQILNRIMQYTLPFIPVFIAESIYAFNKEVTQTAIELVWSFLRGGNGPGGYYYPLLLQLIFVYPIIYFIIKNKDYAGLKLCFWINIAYEVLKTAYLLNSSVHRILILRYIIFLAFGCYLAIGKITIPLKDLLASFVIGLSFMIITFKFGYHPVVVNSWASTSVIAGMYIIPLFYLLYKKINISLNTFAYIGKKSYYIFLTQMLFYYTLKDNNFIPLLRRRYQLLVCIIICLAGGILYGVLLEPLVKKVSDLILKKNKSPYD